MTPGARYAAAIEILDGWLEGVAVEKLLTNWARRNRYAGSKDRAAVRDIVFDSLRTLRSASNALGKMSGRSIALGHCVSAGQEPQKIFSGEGYSPPALNDAERDRLYAKDKVPTLVMSLNLPDWIVEVLAEDLGDGLEPTASALTERAPVDLRVNLAKETMTGAIAALKSDDIDVSAVDDVPTALRVLSNPRRVTGSKAFASGLIELQDAASQAIVAELSISDRDRVLDFCAGGGGKTLAMAGRAPNADYHAWDISQSRLAPLQERAKRAGARVKILSKHPRSAAYDLVLVDAPCSGSGSWRRNPEGKWRLTPAGLEDLQQTQREVLQNASATIARNGTLVYATCSMFQRENRDQVDHFLEQNPDFSLLSDKKYVIGAPGDGFYCAILKNNSSVKSENS